MSQLLVCSGDKIEWAFLPRSIGAVRVRPQGLGDILKDFIFWRVMNEGRMVDGVWLAPGPSSLNPWTWKQNRASVIWVSTPRTWQTLSRKISTKKQTRSRTYTRIWSRRFVFVHPHSFRVTSGAALSSCFLSAFYIYFRVVFQLCNSFSSIKQQVMVQYWLSFLV